MKMEKIIISTHLFGARNMINLPKEIKYKLAKKSKVSMIKLLQEAFEKKKQFSDDHLKNITFFQYLVTVFDYRKKQYRRFRLDVGNITLNVANTTFHINNQ